MTDWTLFCCKLRLVFLKIHTIKIPIQLQLIPVYLQDIIFVYINDIFNNYQKVCTEIAHKYVHSRPGHKD